MYATTMNDDQKTKLDEELKGKLSEEEFNVLRCSATEAPFTGKYWNNHDTGMYECGACGQSLFSSDAKFDSGTGWPSFEDALPGSVKYVEDTSYGMSRVEVVCAKCGSHLGHVFDDGPSKTGKRYCMNSVCLDLQEKKE